MQENKSICIYGDDDWHVYEHDDIKYVKSADKYCKVFVTSSSKHYLVSTTMSDIEEQLPGLKFQRINRSHIIRIKAAVRLNKSCTRVFLKSGEWFVVEPKYIDGLREKFQFLR